MSGDQRAEEAIEIGKRIREFRVKKNMSQAALADKANVSLSQISDIERGKTSMRLTTFIGIVAGFCRCSPSHRHSRSQHAL